MCRVLSLCALETLSHAQETSVGGVVLLLAYTRDRVSCPRGKCRQYKTISLYIRDTVSHCRISFKILTLLIISLESCLEA